ncbi:hypothetical protein F4560_000980 [Saccharothrix ecbatanensis]|uniref:Uncharacterized protein n=1 Tax=Saccharothrix ecbatanensis TaxID=1105145 RepID=A0A7W9HFB0_9PSEU|nr:hypothetical protein [Saccharothrix ecbatanensis]
MSTSGRWPQRETEIEARFGEFVADAGVGVGDVVDRLFTGVVARDGRGALFADEVAVLEGGDRTGQAGTTVDMSALGVPGGQGDDRPAAR